MTDILATSLVCPTCGLQQPFDDGSNITNSAAVVCRGVKVGVVQAVELDAGLGHVNVTAKLDKSASGPARAGAQF